MADPSAFPVFSKSEIEGSVAARFERVARAVPGRPAVLADGAVTSYAELEEAARRVADGLAGRRERGGAPVALLLDAGPPLFAAMLGTMKSGAFYVPLDPRLPDARLAAVLRGLGPATLLTTRARAESARRLAGTTADVRCVEDFGAERGAKAAAPAASPDDLAYVLFTSGSTGEPKGVMQSHRNVLHNVWKLSTGLRIVPEDRLTLLSSPSFGASVSDIFGALLNGAAVCPYDLAGDGLRRLPEFLGRAGITILHCVPSVFRSLATTLDGRDDVSSVRLVKLGGEPVHATDFELYRRRFPRSCVFHVGFGATEINVIRQWFAGHDTPWPGGSPLGFAVDETEIVLIDEDGAETAEAGEIAVVARTLAAGYWRDPDRTAAAFRPAPGRPGARLYRTGDRGRLLPDGCLLHEGRIDGRVKVRGQRVETSAVEAALLAAPGVRETAVDARAGPDGTRLVAWVVRDGGVAAESGALGVAAESGARELASEVGALRRAAAAALPVPAPPIRFVLLDALPRTRTGKIDRSALPLPGPERPPLAVPYAAPRPGAEAAAAEVFARAIGLDRVGADDDFFELGGDSLSALEALADLSERLGAELSVADLLEAPTPRTLAARAGSPVAAPARGLVRLRAGDGPPVVVFPGGAGDGEDLFVARRLARLAGGTAPFYAFRSGPAPHPSASELAADAADALRVLAPGGPRALVGDCLGGVLAFLVARRLAARCLAARCLAGSLADEGGPPPALVLLDAPFPGLARRLRAWTAARAPAADRVARRIAYFGRRLRHHARVLRAHRGGRLAYLLRQGRVGVRGFDPPVPPRGRDAARRRASYVRTLSAARLDFFDGTLRFIESDDGRARGLARAWRRVAAEIAVESVPGDHDRAIIDHAEEIGAALKRWLEITGSAGPPPSP